MKSKKIVCLLLALSCTFSAIAGCSKTEKQETKKENEKIISLSEPDYSGSDKHLNMYAFYSASDGTKKGNMGGMAAGDGTDFRTLETYRMYKEAGFNTLLLENECGYNGEDFATSDLKMVMDMAQKLSLKVILLDYRMNRLSNIKDGLIGEGKEFASEDALKKAVEGYIAPYRNHPAFYGVYLMDEPVYSQMKSVSQVTAALLSIDSNIYVHCCLLPMYVAAESLGGTEMDNKQDVYRGYLDAWFESGVKYVNYDDYMFLLQNDEETTSDSWMACMDIVAEVAKKHGATFGSTSQSFSYYVEEWQKGYRPVTEEDFRWQAYYSLGHGAKNIVYYYYWTDPYGEYDDTTCFIDDYGEKVMYDAGKRVNDEINALAPAILNYDYLGTQYFNNRGRIPSYYSSICTYSSDRFTVADTIEGDLMVCEMKETEGEHYGYMLMNSADPFEKLSLSAEVTFKGYRNAKVYVGGEATTQKLTDGKLSVELEPGEGIFVIPY